MSDEAKIICTFLICVAALIFSGIAYSAYEDSLIGTSKDPVATACALGSHDACLAASRREASNAQ